MPERDSAGNGQFGGEESLGRLEMGLPSSEDMAVISCWTVNKLAILKSSSTAVLVSARSLSRPPNPPPQMLHGSLKFER